MSCGNNKYLIEKYGDIHLHTGGYPLPVNEAEMQECGGSCYYGSSWPQEEALANSIDNPNPKQIVAINNSPDPNKRYATIPQEAADIGVGCMNLNCIAPNCHGAVRCPKSNPTVDQNLMFNREVEEHFSVAGFQLEDQTLIYLLAGLVLFLIWYYLKQ